MLPKNCPGSCLLLLALTSQSTSKGIESSSLGDGLTQGLLLRWIQALALIQRHGIEYKLIIIVVHVTWQVQPSSKDALQQKIQVGDVRHSVSWIYIYRQGLSKRTCLRLCCIACKKMALFCEKWNLEGQLLSKGLCGASLYIYAWLVSNMAWGDNEQISERCFEVIGN